MRRAGESGGWVALRPAVPRAGQPAFNVTGSPPKDALLCQYTDARRAACLPAAAAVPVWRDGQVTDFLVAW